MRNTAKRPIAVIIILLISLFLGLAMDTVWDIAEKKTHPTDFSSYVKTYASEYNIPEYIIFAVIETESGFDKDAESSVGARGLMQMMPSTFEWLTGPEHLGERLPSSKLYDPEISIKYGTYYLNYLYKKFDYNWDNTFAAYNAGEGNVAEWLESDKYSDGKGNLVNIPFKETAHYVKKVNDNIEIYKKLYYKNNEGVTENE
ncbi:MAG: lytic transglycosylase domain-containing protein [Clostridia bacterium]|nr:lytic transglycosylase domain-containing protein [Clostridia bacterium]